MYPLRAKENQTLIYEKGGKDFRIGIRNDSISAYNFSGIFNLENVMDVDLKIKIADFYYSADYHEFAFTTCPHKRYKLDISVYDFADKVQLPETDLDHAGAMYNINAVGFLRVVQALFPIIRDGTDILCVTSEAGSMSANWRSREYSYCMSKAAENMACVLLQKHYDEEGQRTRVMCLHPGWVRSAMGGEEAKKHPEMSVSPEDSAEALVGIALDLDGIPKDCMYMDYQRKPYSW